MTRAAALVVVAIVLAGCHGRNLPADEFRPRANQVCEQTAQQVAPVADLRRLDGARLAQAAERLRAIAKDAESQLAKIIPPDDLTPGYGELVIHVGQLVELFIELEDAAGQGDDQSAAHVLADLRDTLRKARSTAREVGLEQCARAAAQALPGDRDGGPAS